MLQQGLIAAVSEIAFALGTMMTVRSEIEPAARRGVEMQRENGVPMRFDATILRQAEIVNGAVFAVVGAAIAGVIVGLTNDHYGFGAAALGAGCGVSVGIWWGQKTVAWFFMRTSLVQHVDLTPLSDEQRQRSAERRR